MKDNKQFSFEGMMTKEQRQLMGIKIVDKMEK